MRRSRKPRVIYRDSRDRISRIQQAFSLSDEELTGIMLVSPHESARENLPTIGEKNSPEQILCFVQYHYTKRRVAPPFFLA